MAKSSIWTKYQARLTFLTRLCGSVPADPEIIKKWLEARQPTARAPGAKSIQDINEEVLASLELGEQEQEYSLLQFQRQQGALVMRAGTMRAHLKDGARVLSAQYVGRLKGERAFSTRVINGLYLDEATYWLPIRRPDGTAVTQADGVWDKAVHVRGPRGEPLNALKRIEYIDPPSVLDVVLKVLGTSIVEDDLHMLFEYGGTHGYAGERSDGEGRYTFSLTKLVEGGRAATADESSDRPQA